MPSENITAWTKPKSCMRTAANNAPTAGNCIAVVEAKRIQVAMNVVVYSLHRAAVPLERRATTEGSGWRRPLSLGHSLGLAVRGRTVMVILKFSSRPGPVTQGKTARGKAEQCRPRKCISMPGMIVKTRPRPCITDARKHGSMPNLLWYNG